jgi:hypothetical protein
VPISLITSKWSIPPLRTRSSSAQAAGEGVHRSREQEWIDEEMPLDLFLNDLTWFVLGRLMGTHLRTTAQETRRSRPGQVALWGGGTAVESMMGTPTVAKYEKREVRQANDARTVSPPTISVAPADGKS